MREKRSKHKKVQTKEASTIEANGNGVAPYDSLQSYMQEIGRVPLLSVEEERKLARKIKAGDARAREQMILANLRLVVHIARQYENFGIPLSDLISEGNIGLMKAVERFNPRKAKLSTYAAWWIKQAIKRALAEQGKTIRLPVHAVEKVLKLKRVQLHLQETLGRDPTDKELSDATGIPPEKVNLLMEAAVVPVSLETKLGDSDETVAEVIADESAITPAVAAELAGNAQVVQDLISQLPERERIIVKMRFGFSGNGKDTLEKVGKKLGVTRERIRQLQDQVLDKLRLAIARLEEPERIKARNLLFSLRNVEQPNGHA